MNIEQLKSYCGEDWSRVVKHISEALKSDIDLLDRTNSSILLRSGKQLRPLIALLVARACTDGPLPEDTYRVAAAAEILHNATLLHDDVADDSDQRRGAPTLKSLMGASVSVLVGDYWLVAAMTEILEADRESQRLVRIFSKTLSDLAEGEMLQLQKATECDTSEEDYFRIIYSKTASLFEAAALSAAISTGADSETESCLGTYARKLGMAFQIRDDIFDYSGSLSVGKPVGVDILEQKITLPLLGALKNAGASKAAEIRSKVADIVSHPEYAEEIISFVRDFGGLSYAEEVLDSYVADAVTSLASVRKTEAGRYLEEIAGYVAKRRV